MAMRDHRLMGMTARVGPVEFVLRGAGYAEWRDRPLETLSLYEGQPLMVASEGESSFFVLDHRSAPVMGPVRVEYWQAGSSPEGELAGLFIVSDAHHPGDEVECSGLEDLARELSGERRRA
jgi:hypothetical protein